MYHCLLLRIVTSFKAVNEVSPVAVYFNLASFSVSYCVIISTINIDCGIHYSGQIFARFSKSTKLFCVAAKMMIMHEFVCICVMMYSLCGAYSKLFVIDIIKSRRNLTRRRRGEKEATWSWLSFTANWNSFRKFSVLHYCSLIFLHLQHINMISLSVQMYQCILLISRMYLENQIVVCFNAIPMCTKISILLWKNSGVSYISLEDRCFNWGRTSGHMTSFLTILSPFWTSGRRSWLHLYHLFLSSTFMLW